MSETGERALYGSPGRKNKMKNTCIRDGRGCLCGHFAKQMHSEVFDCWKAIRMWRGICFGSSHNDVEKTRQWTAFEVSQIPSDPVGTAGPWCLKATGDLIGTGLVYYEEEYHLFEIGYNFGKRILGTWICDRNDGSNCDFAKNVLEGKGAGGQVRKGESGVGPCDG